MVILFYKMMVVTSVTGLGCFSSIKNYVVSDAAFLMGVNFYRFSEASNKSLTFFEQRKIFLVRLEFCGRLCEFARRILFRRGMFCLLGLFLGH